MFKNNFGQVRSGWIIAFALLMVFIGQTIFMFPGVIMMTIMEISSEGMEITIDMENASPAFIILTQGAGTFGGIAATLVLYRAINKKNPNKLGIQGPVLDFLYGLFLGAISLTIIFFTLKAAGQIEVLNPLSDPMFSSYTLAFLIVYLLVGFFEEMFFRGYVMNTMLERKNQKWVIYVVSAVVFGLAHLMNPNVSMVGILNIMLVGLLFAYMYDKTGSLLLPIGFHITWNFFQGSVYGFAVSGTAPYGLYVVDVTPGNDLVTGGSFGIEGGLMATLLIVLCFLATSIYTKRRTPLLSA